MHAKPLRLFFVLVLALMAFGSPNAAYALERSDWKIGWGPNVVPGPSGGGGGGGHPIDPPVSGGGGGAGASFDNLNGVLVIAPTNYAAALIVCGVSNDDARLTSDVRFKLSHPSYGGEFYEFAQRFSKLSSYDGVPDFYSASNSAYTQQVGFQSSCVTLGKLYGKDNVQACLYYDSELDAARSALDDIMSGGDGGGGGSSGGGGISGDFEMPLSITGVWNNYGQQNANIGSVVTLNFTQSQATQISNYINQNKYDNLSVLVAMYFSYPRNDTISTVTLYWYDSSNISFGTNSFSNRDWPAAESMYNTSGSLQAYRSVRLTVRQSGSVLTCTALDSMRAYNLANNTYTGLGTYYWLEDGSSAEPEPSPDPWPDDDEGDTESPTPPTLPEPTDPTIPTQPGPTTPSPDPTPSPKPNPTGPQVPDLPNIEGGETYTADLQGILDALDEHCIHIQTCLNSNFGTLDGLLGQLFSIYVASIVDAVYNVSSAQISAIGVARDDITLTIRQQLAWLGSDIDLNFDNLLQYLNDLWTWLEETLVFDFSGDTYDDSSLISWLQKIYDKLGDGINTQPVDVVVNPTDTGSWLDQFLASFFGALLGNLAQVLADAAGTMATLTTKFPLSLPWDIAAILGLLVAPPVCPSFSFPCYSLTSSGLEEVGSYDVDLQDVEFAVEGIRWMMRLGFVLVLARHTKDFMELIERVID